MKKIKPITLVYIAVALIGAFIVFYLIKQEVNFHENDDPPLNSPVPLIFVDGEFYVFWGSNFRRKNTDEMKYLGEVSRVDIKGVEEEFVSTCFSTGTPIYRIDENTLYIEYRYESGEEEWALGVVYGGEYDVSVKNGAEVAI